MAESKEVVFNISTTSDGLAEVEQGFEKAEDAAERVQIGAGKVSQALGGMGNIGASSAAEIGASFREAADDTSGAAEIMNGKIKSMGSSAKSFGSAFKVSMGTVLKDGNSTARSVQAGFQGAFAYTEKRFKSFTDSVKTGAKTVSTAFTNPIQTIKDKFASSLLKAEATIKDTGEEADEAGKKIKDMGTKGDGAGSQISNAMKGALKAVMGLAAVKMATDAVKKFTGAAVNAAQESEKVGAKFDSVFGSGASEAEAWAKNFASAAHRSVTEAKGFMAANQGMYTSMGLTSEAAANLSKMTTSLGYDIGAALKLDDADAMGKVQEIVQGNNDALAEYGVQLDDSKIKAAAQAMGIHQSIDALDEATLSQVRFNALLHETEGLQQSATKSIGGITGVTKALNAMQQDFMSKAGEKFAPAIDKAFGVIDSTWPKIEPMLMQFVGILASGFEQAVPIIGNLAEGLLPSLASTLGTLMQVGMPFVSMIGTLASVVLPPLAHIFAEIGGSLLPPLTNIFMTLTESVLKPLLPVFENLIGALLPPFVNLLGMVSPILQTISPVLSLFGELLVPIGATIGNFVSTLLPPLMTILNTLFTSVIQPLMPVLSQLAGALLPPIATLLGAVAPILGVISPILQAVSPVLEVIGKALGVIGDVLGKVVGFLADGVGKVTGFFSNLFGGAKDSAQEVKTLSGAMTDLGAATSNVETPVIDIPTPSVPVIEFPPPVVPMPVVEIPEIPAPVISPVELPDIGAADTSEYTKSISAATKTAETDTQKAWSGIDSTTSDHLQNIGAAAEQTYASVAQKSENAWQRMVNSATEGARGIVAAFQQIRAAANGISGANVSVGVQMPHHAKGTNNFEGGWTHINEEGGEAAFLPQGTAIIPADKTDRILSTSSNSTKQSVFAPNIKVEFTGNPSNPQDVASFKAQLKELIRETYRELQESDYEDQAYDAAFV